jgi:hypothetical protein
MVFHVRYSLKLQTQDRHDRQLRPSIDRLKVDEDVHLFPSNLVFASVEKWQLQNTRIGLGWAQIAKP